MEGTAVVDRLTLDVLDEQMIHALQVDGRASMRRIADVLGTSDGTLARRYRRLRSAGALRVLGVAASDRTGLMDWSVLVHAGPDTVVALAAALARRADTSWVSVLSGGTALMCVAHVPAGPTHRLDLLRQVPREPGVTVDAQCLLRAIAGTRGWPGRTSALSAGQVAELRPPPPAEPPRTLTANDRALFAELARDGRAAFGHLATVTGVPESSLRRRLGELRRSGQLRFEVETDPVLFGSPVTAVLRLEVTPAHLDGLAAALDTHVEVAFAATTTGPANVLAFAVCRDLDDLHAYLATRLGSLPGVRRIDSALLSHSVKRVGALLTPIATVHRRTGNHG